MLTLLGLALYLPGITWGLPGVVSWSQDTIAAQRTLGAVAGWPREWRGRYPPLQYLVLHSVYQPILRHWRHDGQCTMDPQTGAAALKPPHAPKVGLLILVARCVTVLMAVATGLGVWATARRLMHSDLAALVAAIAIMIGAGFTYFAHLGNVDVPSMCWLAWSMYFYVRAVESSAWTDCLWLGIFSALAVGTKDAAAGVLPGMALVLLGAETLRRHSGLRVPSRTCGTDFPVGQETGGKASPTWVVSEDPGWGMAFVSSLWQWRWLIGLAGFILPYLLISGAIFDPQGCLARMRYWISPSPDSVLAGEYRHPHQTALFLHTLRVAAGGVGWPMLAAMIVAVGYTLWRRRAWALMMLAPALGYYVIVIAPIRFVYERFLFPPLAMVGVLLGAAVADGLRRRDWPVEWRCGVPLLILLPSLAYAAAIDVAMITDSRYDAEAWFVEHVQPPSSIGAFSKAQYLPRLSELGYATYALEMTRESFDRPQPEYLVLTSYDYEDYDATRRACMGDLIAGRLGYELVMTFKGRYLGTGSSWLSLAGWGAPVPGKISPRIVVLRRVAP